MDNLRYKINNWLAENKESMINDTMELLKINSESYNREEVQKALTKTMEIAESLGFKTEIRANGEVGVVLFGKGVETLGILAHIDVVPIGDIAAWTRSPFGEIFEDKIFGRGIIDNKGMVISSLYAMAAVKSLNMPIYKNVELIIGTREEISWDDLLIYEKENHPLPNYGFTPDGEFPIINREKGNCELCITFADESCDGEFELMDLKSGEAVNSIPDRAWAKIKGNFDILKNLVLEFNGTNKNEKLAITKKSDDISIVSASGKAAHSSLPEHGDNALVTLCSFLSTLCINNKAVKNLSSFVHNFFNDNYYGDKLGLPKHEEFINGEEMGRTTVAPTIVYKEKEISLYLSIRSVFATKKNEVINVFDKLRKQYNFNFVITDYLDPLYVPRDHKFIEILEQAYGTVTNTKAEFILAGGTTYAKAIPNTVAFGPVFPDDIDNAHQKDEFIVVDNFMKATEIYSLVVAEVLLNENSLK